ncbi:MAG: PAS domain-containing sensor histidine kinase [Nitrospinae bacterium]|nr:PAS domain-containing sensor histidine kinase [Nitrospinota bacterium]
MLHNPGVKQSLKKLGMRYAKLRRIVDGVGVMVAELDFGGVIRFVTPSARKVIGFAPGDIVGSHISRFIHREDLDEFERLLAPWTVYENETVQARFRFLHADDSWRWLSIAGCEPAQRPEISGVIITFHDVTSGKFAEDGLAKAKEESERNVAIRTKFMSIMAHDLRSPLTAIYGLLKLLGAKPDGVGCLEKREEIIERILNSVQQMLNLTDDILSINRFVKGKFEPRFAPVNCAESVGGVIARLKNLADIKGIQVAARLDPGLWLLADRPLFEEAVGNLVTNAIKFSGEGDRVEIFDPPARAGVIAVKDTGAGIDPQLINDLFKEDVKTSTNGTAGERGTVDCTPETGGFLTRN